jgi:excisionase family DNA binding protein
MSWITTTEAAARMDVNPRSGYITRLIRDGRIIGRRAGRTWLVDSNSLDAFIGAKTDGWNLTLSLVDVDDGCDIIIKATASGQLLDSKRVHCESTKDAEIVAAAIQAGYTIQ